MNEGKACLSIAHVLRNQALIPITPRSEVGHAVARLHFSDYSRRSPHIRQLPRTTEKGLIYFAQPFDYMQTRRLIS